MTRARALAQLSLLDLPDALPPAAPAPLREVLASPPEAEPPTEPARLEPDDSLSIALGVMTGCAEAQAATADLVTALGPRALASPDPEGPASIALEIAENLAESTVAMGELAADLAPEGDDICGQIVACVKAATARDEAEYAHLRTLHARLIGCSVEELDARVAEGKAREKAEREERKAQRGRGPEAPGSTPARECPAPEAPARRGKRTKAEPAEPALPPTKTLTARQQEMLRGFEVDGLNVARCLLTDHQPDWSELKAVMTALGGRWQKGGKKVPGGFAFPDDIDGREVVRVALESGVILDPKAAGYFPTSEPLADRLASLLDLRPGDTVLEPSAGRGALALAVRRACPEARVQCVELLPDNRTALEALGFELIGTDFLSLTPEPRFTAVIANPPFGARADVVHITRMLEWLAPGGRLAAIASSGVQYRDDGMGREFRALLQSHGARITENPPGSFAAVGTQVSTVTISLRKGGAR